MTSPHKLRFAVRQDNWRWRRGRRASSGQKNFYVSKPKDNRSPPEILASKDGAEGSRCVFGGVVFRAEVAVAMAHSRRTFPWRASIIEHRYVISGSNIH